jgi:hypothetical protein
MVFRCFLLVAMVATALTHGTASAQDVLTSVPKPLPPRKLADGVMTVVPPDENANDTIAGTFDLDFVEKHPELAWTAPDFPENKPFFASAAETLLEKSRNVAFRHDVWYLEFAFKPVRVILVDVPGLNGVIERKVAWYMVYSVRYPGRDLKAEMDESSEIPGSPALVKSQAVRFLPRFTLVSKERNFAMDAQVLPTAKAAIEAKERVGKPLFDHIEMAQQEIKQSDSPEDAVWGVAIWTDIDPRVDFFAVDVRGLSNAFKMKTDSSGEMRYERKTLRIYHWRAGDGIEEYKDVIRLGIPAFEDPARLQYHLKQFNLEERLDYQWIYR